LDDHSLATFDAQKDGCKDFLFVEVALLRQWWIYAIEILVLFLHDAKEVKNGKDLSLSA